MFNGGTNLERRLRRLGWDGNGNPRYELHWLDFLSEQEQEDRHPNYEGARARAISLGWRAEKKNGAETGWFRLVSHRGVSGLAEDVTGQFGK